MFPCNFTRTDRKQVVNNKIGEIMRGEVIVMLGCVKMAYLAVPLRDRRGNISIRSATVHSRTTTVLNPCVTLIIRKCHRAILRMRYGVPPWIVVESYLNLRDTVYNRRRPLLAPLLSVVSPFETVFTTVHHDFSIRVESWWIVVRTVTV